MDYKELGHIYYSDHELYEIMYKRRFSSIYTHHINFDIREWPAFFVVTPEIQSLMISIRKADKKVYQLCRDLPNKAIEQFSLRCLVDEIVLTNNIEGVHSTRREIDQVISSLGEKDRRMRFKGLVQKYIALRTRIDIPLQSCRDIRDIYDELFLPEVAEDDPKNIPDGEIFRKGPVSVHSATQKEIHRGLYPEKEIIAAMEKALDYLNDENEDILFRTAVFHYLIGFIHPFYDGNGRLNRFISSYMLAKELEPVLSYRLSYTVKENIEKYYAAFKISNNPLNRGDLTPFVFMFLEIVEKSILLLKEALQKRLEQLNHYEALIIKLPYTKTSTEKDLYSILIQVELFSEHGISTMDLIHYLGVSRGTVNTKLMKIEEAGFLKKNHIKRENFFGIDLQALDRYVDA